jgi:hypothetical protein
LTLRQVAPAAISMIAAKEAITAVPLEACPSAVPAITPGTVPAMNATAWRQHTRPSRAWLMPPTIAPTDTITSDPVVAW